jgi:hypothetical protein
MIYRLYTVFDKVAEEAGPIFQAKNDGVALRNFGSILQSQGLNPEDYKLLYLADYDTEGKGFAPSDVPPGLASQVRYLLPFSPREITPNKVAEAEVRG